MAKLVKKAFSNHRLAFFLDVKIRFGNYVAPWKDRKSPFTLSPENVALSASFSHDDFFLTLLCETKKPNFPIFGESSKS